MKILSKNDKKLMQSKGVVNILLYLNIIHESSSGIVGIFNGVI